MNFDPDIHRRRSIRLVDYDYSSAGFYFVTICVQGRELLLGEVVDDEVVLNDSGQMVETIWTELPQRFANVQLDRFVVMPNHFHGIIILKSPGDIRRNPDSSPVGAPLAAPSTRQYKIKNQNTGAQDTGVQNTGVCHGNKGAASSAPTDNKTLGDVIRAYKSISAISVNKIFGKSGQPLWQRNYYERIIRNENELHNIRQYIHDNPAKWADDNENPANHPTAIDP